MSKLPSFQFYPGDWRKDGGLQSCSLGARALWLELMLAMFEGPDRYTLMNPDGSEWTLGQMARWAGETPGITKRHLDELEAAGVPSRDGDGRLYSRRMKRDEELRQARAEAGRAGGRASKPKANRKQTGSRTPSKGEANTEAKRGSSSSTSSSSSDNPPIPPELDTQDFRKAWAEWESHRKHKRAKLTPEAERRQVAKCVEWGERQAIAAIHHSIEQGYTGLFEPNRSAAKTQEPRYVAR